MSDKRPLVSVRPVDNKPDCVVCEACEMTYGPFDTRAEAGAYAQGHRDAHAQNGPSSTSEPPSDSQPYDAG